MSNKIFDELLQKKISLNSEILAPLKNKMLKNNEMADDSEILQKFKGLYNSVMPGRAQMQQDIANGKLKFIGNDCCVKINTQPECAPFRWQIYSCSGGLLLNLPSNLPVNITKIGNESLYLRTSKAVDAQQISITATENYIVFNVLGTIPGKLTSRQGYDAVAIDKYNHDNIVQLGEGVNMYAINDESIESKFSNNAR